MMLQEVGLKYSNLKCEGYVRNDRTSCLIMPSPSAARAAISSMDMAHIFSQSLRSWSKSEPFHPIAQKSEK